MKVVTELYERIGTKMSPFKVNVDTDEDNNGSLSVFINYGIIDTNGDILGACGVGVDMNDLVDILARFEEEYNIKVYLVNHDGLIQVDTDVSSIETGYLDNLAIYQMMIFIISYRRMAVI